MPSRKRLADSESVARPSHGPSKHEPGCECTRCRGFGKGNALAVVHGARSVVALEPRSAEIADEIRELVPARSPSDEPSIRLLALALAQVEAATSWLAENGIVDENGNARSLLKHLGTMMNTSARIADRLGCTPTSRATLGLDVARMRATEDGLENLRQRGAEIMARRAGELGGVVDIDDGEGVGLA